MRCTQVLAVSMTLTFTVTTSVTVTVLSTVTVVMTVSQGQIGCWLQIKTHSLT